MRAGTIAGVGLAMLLAAATGPSLPTWSRCTVPANTEIFSGITYGCELLHLSPEGRGIIHWVQIDLSAPGIELYVTPVDPAAVQQGFEYRLRTIGDVVEDERLAVAINGTLFTSTLPLAPAAAGRSRQCGRDGGVRSRR